jgi:hypothetical protein
MLASPTGFAQTPEAKSPTSVASTSVLAMAVSHSKERGLPLLILRSPENEKTRYLLGRMWGTFFSLGTQAMLEELALCEIVCAPDAQILRELPDVINVKDWTSGIALLIEPVTKKPVVVAGPIVFMPWSKVGDDLHDSMAAALEDVRTRLHAVIAPDRPTIERRARENRAALSDAEFAALGAVGKTSDIELCRTQARLVPACLLLEHVESEPGLHSPVFELWEIASQRVRTAPAGSRWDLPTQDCLNKAFHLFDRDEGCTMPGPAGRSTPAARFLHLMDEAELNSLSAQTPKPARK